MAESLNNTQIGGKKRSKFHDDIWNIRYLKGFKWHHLTEKLCKDVLFWLLHVLTSMAAYENAVRAQKHRNELSAAKKEYDFIMEKHQQAKVVENIQKRRVGLQSSHCRHTSSLMSGSEAPPGGVWASGRGLRIAITSSPLQAA